MRVPRCGPLLRILIEPIKKKEVKKPNMCWDIWIETMVGLELKKEVLPLLTISVGDVVPQALNACVVDAPIVIALACRQMWIRERSRNFIPAPDVRTTACTTVMLHPFCDTNVLSSMITANSARSTVAGLAVMKEEKNSFCTIVVMDTNANNKARMTVNEGMLNQLPSDEG